MMKSIDLNLIKYERLFQDDLYYYVYNKSNEYKNLLPNYVNLGSVYLKNFVNYEPSENAKRLVPNSSSYLTMLFGCREYLFVEQDRNYKRLYLYFHNISLMNIDFQCISIIVCKHFSDIFYKYEKTEDFIYSLTNIETYRDEFRQMIYDYIYKNDILNRIIPLHDKLKDCYDDEDIIKIPF